MERHLTALAALILLATSINAQTPYRKTFSDSKQVSVEGTLNANGQRSGNWTWWYPTGQMSQQGSYINGKKTGVWTLYYEDGSRLAEECYSNGVSRR